MNTYVNVQQNFLRRPMIVWTCTGWHEEEKDINYIKKHDQNGDKNNEQWNVASIHTIAFVNLFTLIRNIKTSTKQHNWHQAYNYIFLINSPSLIQKSP